jgi:hypothetical protein
MPNKSFADLLAAVQQMVTAAQANQEELASRGMSETFIGNATEMLAALEAADAEQERLKASLKTATTQVEDLQKQLKDWLNEATNVVKLAYRNQQEKWIEFGVKAKR